MKTLFIFLLFSLLQIHTILSQNVNPQQSIFDVMHYTEVLDITLKTDINALKNKRRSKEAQKAVLRFENALGQVETWDIKLNLRGRFRRMNCEMPPLKLDFKKSDLEQVGLANFDDIKLVTHCVANKNEAKTLLLKEYLAYQLYNELSPNSYRVQLIKITYEDVVTGAKDRQWGFLIEDTAQLRARMGAEKASQFDHQLTDFDVETVKNVAIFQYLIGNTDWQLLVGHNLKMVKKGDKIIPIPYDFDFSGLVNASYAVPNADYNLISNQERIMPELPDVFMDWHDTVYFYHGQREKLLKLVKDFKVLKKESRNEVITYLSEYLDNVADIKVYSSKKPEEVVQMIE